MTASKEPILESTLTCPHCSFQKQETMPTDSCQFFWECPECKQLHKPLEGDCCVFCSYGDVPCPPIQEGGYDLKKVYFHLQGTLEQADGNYTLKDKYTGKRYILQAVPENAAVGKAVTIKAHLDAKSLATLKPEQTISIIVDELK